jgi:hypothetical protein
MITYERKVDFPSELFRHSKNKDPIGGEWLASHSDCSVPQESAPCTHFIGGWVGPRFGLSAVEKKMSCPCWELSPESRDVQPVTRRFTDEISRVLQ